MELSKTLPSATKKAEERRRGPTREVEANSGIFSVDDLTLSDDIGVVVA